MKTPTRMLLETYNNATALENIALALRERGADVQLIMLDLDRAKAGLREAWANNLIAKMEERREHENDAATCG